jgi:hypothetical protein
MNLELGNLCGELCVFSEQYEVVAVYQVSFTFYSNIQIYDQVGIF